MKSLKVIARFNIKSGNIQTFKKLEAECITEVEEKDHGTLQYDWYYDGQETECVVLEAYQSSEALLEHLSHVGEQLGKMMEIADFSAEIYGEPSSELLKATEGLNIKIYGYSDGI